MFGTVERQEIPGELPINIPVTLAGPSDGFVSKAAYNCNIDYEVTLTNGGIGTGQVGVSTCCPITYNPNCVVGVDEEGNDIIKGVLKVDCIIAKDMQGADCACYINKETFNDNVGLPIALWSTDDSQSPYFPMGVSGGYELSYNPISGYLRSPFANFCCAIETNKIDIGTSTFTQNTLNVSSENFVLSVGSCNFQFNCDGNFSATRVSANALSANYICSLDGCCLMGLDNDAIRPNVEIISNEQITAPDLTACNLYGNPNLWLYGRNYVCIRQCSDDACSWVYLTNGCVNICGCSYICLHTEGDVTINKLRSYEDVCFLGSSKLYVECGIVTGYDLIFKEDGLANGTSGYIYCNTEFCLCGGRITDCIERPNCNYHSSWANSCCIPNEHEIHEYLYWHCAVNAYSSGTTLFIRTQGCANWS